MDLYSKPFQNFNRRKMRTIYFYTLIAFFICIGSVSSAQNSYFFNQKNLISVHASVNPRLVPMYKNNSGSYDMYGLNGLGKGTYYQYYDDENNLRSDHQKYNLMLNTSYGRVIGKHNIIGIEFNYQKHHLTVNSSANMGIDEYSYENSYEYTKKPFLLSTPVFNVFDLQLFSGRFDNSNIAPNKHLLTYGAGVRIFSLDKSQNYRKSSGEPYTDLAKFMHGYDDSFVFVRFSLNYTFRILITKNLSFDIGLNTNLTMTLDFDDLLGGIDGYDYIPKDFVAYSRDYVKSNLGSSTFFNMFYLRTGLSYAF